MPFLLSVSLSLLTSPSLSPPSLSVSPLSLPISLSPPSPSLYDRCFVNRYVFSGFFNVTRHWLCLACTGSELQVVGPNTENDLFTNFPSFIPVLAAAIRWVPSQPLMLPQADTTCIFFSVVAFFPPRHFNPFIPTVPY